MNYSLNNDLAVMFDLYIPDTSNSTPILYLRGQLPTLSVSNFPRNIWHNVKIEFRNLNIKIYKNNSFLYELNPSSQNYVFQFRCANAELSFKNFIIYEIP